MVELTVRVKKRGESPITELQMEFEDIGLAEFLFSDGEYACDCNRALFFDGSDQPCGDEHYLAEVLHGEDIIYSDF